jgi:replicative DNA helicase
LNTFDPVLETRVIKTALDGQDARFIVNLTSDWFGLPIAREIWERIQTLRTNGKQIPKTQTMASDPVLSEGAQTLLKGDLNGYETHEVENAMEQLDYFRKGRVISASTKKILDTMSSPQADLATAKLTMERCLAALESSTTNDDTLTYGYENEKALEFYDKVMNKPKDEKFIPTGFKFIDDKQGGLMRGKLYAIGAISGGGKSTLVNQICINAYESGYSSNFNSFEMGKEECLMRTQANRTRIPMDRFLLDQLTAAERSKSDKVFARFLSIGDRTGKRLEYNCPSKDINIPQLITMIEPLKFDIVVVDYINLMAMIDPKKDLWWNLGEGFRVMKRFAERTRCAVLMVVQIDEKEKAIKYAKAIRHHSDGVWMWNWGPAEMESGVVEVEQNKLRNFKPAKFNLSVEFEYAAFSESSIPTHTIQGVMAPAQLKPMTL